MRSRILLQWLAGTLGGLLGWLLTEPVPYFNQDVAPGQPAPSVDFTTIILFGVVTGAAISACIGAAYGAGSRAKVRRSALIGAGAGVVGGGLGLAIGQLIYQTIQTAAEPSTSGVLAPVGMLGMILARALGWAAVGAGMGVLQGAINGSVQRSRNGLIGGTIGGLIGGVIFELLGLTVIVTSRNGHSPFFLLNGALLRGISLTVTGSAIGLFVGLTERALRNAWVRVRVGRNEGQEFMLEKGTSSIGRDELSDIPLFGDMAVNRHHATIKSAGGGAYTIEALAPGVSVNGQPVQVSPLHEADIITIGSREIEFHQKGAPRAVPQRDVAKPAAAPVPVPEGVCPFCGERRNARGECACAPVPSGSAASAPPAPVATANLNASPGVPHLVGLTGPFAGQSVPLDRAEVTVGREPGRDVVITDPSVSRHHARIVVGSGTVEVVDEGSANGTYVNGARVDRRAVRPGDEVRFGSSAFRIEAA